MNRLLSILVTLFILFLVYLWINHLMGSSDEKTRSTELPTLAPDVEPTDPPPADLHIPDYDSPEGNPVVPAETNDSEEVNTDEVKEVQPEVREPEKPKTVTPDPPKATPPPKPNPEPVQQITRPQDKDAGAHLVIAGNFLERANAEERVRELKKIGYNKAEVVNFELSEYHTACAGRYNDINEARRVAKKIKDQHGIDTYVRHGN